MYGVASDGDTSVAVVVQTDHGVGGVSADALAAFANALASAAQRPTLPAALADVAEAARAVTRADVVLVRVGTHGSLETVAVAGPPALAAELEGTQLAVEELPAATVDDVSEAPEAVRRAAARSAARSILVVPVRTAETSACLELLRSSASFSQAERVAAELAAAHAALVLRAFGGRNGSVIESLAGPALELAGEALAAALDEAHTAAEVVRVAATVVGAPIGLLWELSEDGSLQLDAAYGLDPATDLEAVRTAALASLAEPRKVATVPAEGLPGDCGASATLPLGQPPVGVLQLLFESGEDPGAEQLGRLATFGVRAAHALRASAHARWLELELERMRALVAVVGQATAELSLAHTLETVVERVAELLAVEHVAVYLRADDDRLVTAAGSGLVGPHARLAERLLEIALGPARTRRVVDVPDAARDDRIRGDARDAARESGIGTVLAAPLLVRNDVIGLLAVYPQNGRPPTEQESALLAALAGQLAVAVQNAQLHERTSELSQEREAALASEREKGKVLGALYEVSRSFAQELSLQKTLDALTSTIVDVLDIDAALIEMPDERRELLARHSIHVKDKRLDEAVKAILSHPQPFGAAHIQRLFRAAEPFRLQRGNELLEPFLARGWTAALIPIATPAEVIAALTILSFRPGSPISGETVEIAAAIADQTALAIDNARLYQQQKAFADTMQRSLLPRERPEVAGLELGEVYESSARVDVGGDVYDFLRLDDGRLAVVLGDVTGHGVEATADMAMAKFVFRSLAREHPEPAEFLAAANDVVVDEIASGKFITMTYLTVDGVKGEVRCASAGHPAPRLVLPNGGVRALEARGLVLGVDPGQEYDEVQAELPSGAAVVLYTDGVIEARRGGELYGSERLDALLAVKRDLGARTLALAVTEDCRSFAGGDLPDDVAVVVIRRI